MEASVHQLDDEGIDDDDDTFDAPFVDTGQGRREPALSSSSSFPRSRPAKTNHRFFRGSGGGEDKVWPRRRLLPTDKTRQMVLGRGLDVLAWGEDLVATRQRRQKRRPTMFWPLDPVGEITQDDGQRICQSSLLNGILRTYCEGRNLTDVLDDENEIPPETVYLYYQNNKVIK